MADPSVSVVTPSYNQREYIGDTIESVRNQTYDDVTHVVVDGGSDDGTRDLLEGSPDLDWISESDDGQADAINKGFRRADGDIVGWLNSDDPYVYRDVVESVVDVFEQTDADIVFGHALLIDGVNRVLRVLHVPEYDRARLERHCYLVQPSVFFRSEVINKHLLDVSLNYSIDYEFWLRLDDYEWRRINRVLAADRNHNARKTIADTDDSRQETIRLREGRGLYDQPYFRIKQLWDKVRWRLERMKGLPLLYNLYTTPRSEFAIELQRPSRRTALGTQLYRRKQEFS